MHSLLFLSFSSTSISVLRTYISRRIYRKKNDKNGNCCPDYTDKMKQRRKKSKEENGMMGRQKR
jgi:hypothetical protein